MVTKLQALHDMNIVFSEYYHFAYTISHGFVYCYVCQLNSVILNTPCGIAVVLYVSTFQDDTAYCNHFQHMMGDSFWMLGHIWSNFTTLCVTTHIFATFVKATVHFFMFSVCILNVLNHSFFITIDLFHNHDADKKITKFFGGLPLMHWNINIPVM